MSVNNVRQFDATYNTSFQARGNVTSSTTLRGISNVTQIDMMGDVLQSSDQSGVNVTTNSNQNTNYGLRRRSRWAR